MRRDVLKLTGSIYRANKSTSKTEHLDAFLDEFELLKLKIRLCGASFNYQQAQTIIRANLYS